MVDSIFRDNEERRKQKKPDNRGRGCSYEGRDQHRGTSWSNYPTSHGRVDMTLGFGCMDESTKKNLATKSETGIMRHLSITNYILYKSQESNPSSQVPIPSSRSPNAHHRGHPTRRSRPDCPRWHACHPGIDHRVSRCTSPRRQSSSQYPQPHPHCHC